MDSEEQFERIDQYLFDQLDQEELNAFQSKMSHDDGLKQQVERRRMILKGIQGLGIKEQILQIHEEEQQQKTGKNLILISGIAASLLVLVVTWIIYFNDGSEEQLFADNFQPYPDVVSVRGETSTTFTKGMKYYSSGKYELAIKNLNIEASSDNHFVEGAFYSGISLLALNKGNEAIGKFEKVIDRKTRFLPQLRWYLGLSYLLNSEIEKAKDIFIQIESGDYKFEDAQDLLKKL